MGVPKLFAWLTKKFCIKQLNTQSHGCLKAKINLALGKKRKISATNFFV